MKKDMKKALEHFKKFVPIIAIILFLIFMAMIILGQKSIGYPGLITMLIGLAGILTLIYFYNKGYQ